jgi:hypothetical protein
LAIAVHAPSPKEEANEKEKQNAPGQHLLRAAELLLDFLAV